MGFSIRKINITKKIGRRLFGSRIGSSPNPLSDETSPYYQLFDKMEMRTALISVRRHLVERNARVLSSGG